jgi:hypothetical protein
MKDSGVFSQYPPRRLFFYGDDKKEEMQELQGIICPGCPQQEATKVLFQTAMQKGEQSAQSGKVVAKT